MWLLCWLDKPYQKSAGAAVLLTLPLLPGVGSRDVARLSAAEEGGTVEEHALLGRAAPDGADFGALNKRRVAPAQRDSTAAGRKPTSLQQVCACADKLQMDSVLRLLQNNRNPTSWQRMGGEFSPERPAVRVAHIERLHVLFRQRPICDMVLEAICVLCGNLSEGPASWRVSAGGMWSDNALDRTHWARRESKRSRDAKTAGESRALSPRSRFSTRSTLADVRAAQADACGAATAAGTPRARTTRARSCAGSPRASALCSSHSIRTDAAVEAAPPMRTGARTTRTRRELLSGPRPWRIEPRAQLSARRSSDGGPPAALPPNPPHRIGPPPVRD